MSGQCKKVSFSFAARGQSLPQGKARHLRRSPACSWEVAPSDVPDEDGRCDAPDRSRGSMRVHRCRFVEHTPHAIESVDVEPGASGRLAVLRANADIEIWSLKRGEMYCEMRLAGAVDTPVRRVAWGVRSPRHPYGRLFSCGLHGLVTEWDLRTLSPRSSWDSLGGAAWTMTVHAGRQLLAVGCEDGGCSVFDLSDEGLSEPPLVHRTAPQNGRLLSVAFSPQGTHLACSAADGSVRIWHAGSWQALCHYVLESDGRKKPPLVWSVQLLADLTVVTVRPRALSMRTRLAQPTSAAQCLPPARGTEQRPFSSSPSLSLSLGCTAFFPPPRSSSQRSPSPCLSVRVCAG